MGDFRRDNRDRGFSRNNSRGRFGRSDEGFGGRRDRGNFGRSRPEMHDVVCDKCGKNCQVPFKPTGDKPVLCSECFGRSGNSSRDRSFSNSSSGAGISSDQFKELNSKLDKILNILSNIEFEEMDEEAEDSEEEEEL